MLYLLCSKANKSIVEYKCKQCNEGNVCLDCAAKLWKTNSKTMSYCRFSPEPQIHGINLMMLRWDIFVLNNY